MAELVVFLAFLGVAENIVCFSSLLKFLFSLLVVRILVGMVFQRHLPVGFPYFIWCSAFVYAQNFVVVSFSCHCSDFSL